MPTTDDFVKYTEQTAAGARFVCVHCYRTVFPSVRSFVCVVMAHRPKPNQSVPNRTLFIIVDNVSHRIAMQFRCPGKVSGSWWIHCTVYHNKTHDFQHCIEIRYAFALANTVHCLWVKKNNAEAFMKRGKCCSLFLWMCAHAQGKPKKKDIIELNDMICKFLTQSELPLLKFHYTFCVWFIQHICKGENTVEINEEPTLPVNTIWNIEGQPTQCQKPPPSTHSITWDSAKKKILNVRHIGYKINLNNCFLSTACVGGERRIHAYKRADLSINLYMLIHFGRFNTI